MDIKNKNIVITGGSDGIGLEVVKKLFERKANVIVISRHNEKIKDLNVKFCPCDLKDNQQISTTIAKIINDFPQIHGLINNAGIWQKQDILENISDQVIDDVISTNLIGLIKVTKKLLPILKEQEEAVIINVSSSSGVKARERQNVYCASKFGVYGFTESLRLDLKNSKIKITGIYQGGTNTQFFAKANDMSFPYQTFTNPTDLAEAIVFALTQPKNIWIDDIRIER
jgi:short-subunit dehydrogenase